MTMDLQSILTKLGGIVPALQQRVSGGLSGIFNKASNPVVQTNATQTITPQLSDSEIIQQFRSGKITLTEADRLLNLGAPPSSTSTVIQNSPPDRFFDFKGSGYLDNQGDHPMVLKQPPKAIADLIWEHYPNEATTAAMVMNTENQRFDPLAELPAEYNELDPDGGRTPDRGLYQIHGFTFNDFMRRYPNTLRKMGITSYEDMKDPAKNVAFSTLVRKEQGWKAWKGPAYRGYTIKE